ncbi:uncharacterized protein J3R85_012451 [Psidium guajava]|nr:uncharacterized protein J3R85_012451 [Psidium guajava]
MEQRAPLLQDSGSHSSFHRPPESPYLPLPPPLADPGNRFSAVLCSSPLQADSNTCASPMPNQISMPICNLNARGRVNPWT